MTKTNKELLVEDKKDIEQLQQLLKIRNNLMNYIDVEKLIKTMVKIIDDSENFNFRSEHARNFINKEKPVFTIYLQDDNLKFENAESLKEGFTDSIEERVKEYEEKVEDKLYEDVIKHIGESLYDSLHEDKELIKILEENDLKMSDLMITNIFVYRLTDPYTNIINLSLFN